MNSLALRARLFEESTKDPLRAQERTLFKYLARNRNTEYGLKYNFSGIKSIADFRSRVPLVDFKDISSYIERMKKGDGNILTADKVIAFSNTSGTTGMPKFIPVTRYSRDRKSDLMNLWAYYACRDHPKVFDGKILGIISAETENRTEGGIPYGAESGVAYNGLPQIMKRLYVLPYRLFYIKDFDARYYSMLRIAMEHDITTIATLNPSTIVLLCQRIEALQDRIIEDIEKGTLSKDFKVEPDIRLNIEKTLRPNPKRAGELKAILEERKKLLPKYFWPNLDLIECWKGGTVKLYLKGLPQYFGDVAVRDFGCLSTEARSSVPMSDEGAGGVLAIGTNFYEYIPKEDIDKDDKRVLLCDQVEEGREYLLIVTTAGGLYRYNMDDVIKVDGFFNKTPAIEFVQKGHNAISITGEKVYESHVNEAVNRAADKHKILIKAFCASVATGNTSRYVYSVEFYETPSLDEKRKLLASIEEELYEENNEYYDLRTEHLLGSPILSVVKEGEFERYRREKVSQGGHDTQFKLPKLFLKLDFYKEFEIEENIYLD